MKVPVRVVIVDDHDVVRRGLRSILSACADLEIAGEASTGRQALQLIATTKPDVVLLDLQLPDMHGLDVLSTLGVANGEGPAVVVLTVHDDDDIVLKAVKAGAKAYVLKHATGDELLRVIRHVAQGGQVYDPVVVQAFMRDEQRTSDLRILTDHELEVLRMVAAGATNREIGQQLYLSADTVKSHLETIYRKLQVADRTHAVAVAMRKGLLA